MPPGPERAPAEDEAATTLSEDLRLVVGEARTYAKAELAWQKARAVHAGQQAAAIGALAGIALLLASLALLALIVGLLLALAPLIGPWGAMGAVTGGLLLVALICAGLAAARGKRLARDIADRNEA